MPDTPSIADIYAGLSAPFGKESLKWKAQVVGQKGSALASFYIDARDVMDRLDAVVGPTAWSDEYEPLGSGAVICHLKVRLGDTWVSHTDVGAPSQQPDPHHKMKAAFSDAFKRAAIKFGVGRYLHQLKGIWIRYDIQNKRFLDEPNWNVIPLPPHQKPAGRQQAAPQPQAPAPQQPKPAQQAPPQQPRPAAAPAPGQDNTSAPQQAAGSQLPSWQSGPPSQPAPPQAPVEGGISTEDWAQLTAACKASGVSQHLLLQAHGVTSPKTITKLMLPVMTQWITMQAEANASRSDADESEY